MSKLLSEKFTKKQITELKQQILFESYADLFRLGCTGSLRETLNWEGRGTGEAELVGTRHLRFKLYEEMTEWISVEEEDSETTYRVPYWNISGIVAADGMRFRVDLPPYSVPLAMLGQRCSCVPSEGCGA